MQVAEEVPEHLQSTAKVPLSKVQNPQKCPVEPCDEVATRPGVYPDFAHVKHTSTPTRLPWPRKGKVDKKENKGDECTVYLFALKQNKQVCINATHFSLS